MRHVMLVVNCKNYTGMSEGRLKALVESAARSSERYGVSVAIAPAHHQLGLVSRSRVTALAQHVDAVHPGGTTGFVVPEILKEAGVAGSIINHSEHRLNPTTIASTVSRLRDLGMLSVVCTRNVRETAEYAGLEPDYVAIEPPELIGTGRSVSTEQPDLIRDAARAVSRAGTRSALLCGAGIVTGDDITRAMALGSKGVLVASGIVKADNPGDALDGLAKSMAGCA